MNTLSYSAFRRSLATVLDQVNADHQPVLITRQNGKPAVIMSLEDYKSYEETFYLMASPENAKRMKRAMEQVAAGKAKPHNLIED